jgi:hypothetical protein
MIFFLTSMLPKVGSNDIIYPYLRSCEFQHDFAECLNLNGMGSLVETQACG